MGKEGATPPTYIIQLTTQYSQTMKKCIIIFLLIACTIGLTGHSIRSSIVSNNVINASEIPNDTILNDTIPSIVGKWYLSYTRIDNCTIVGNDNPWLRFLDEGHGEYYGFSASEYPSSFEWQLDGDTLLTIKGYRPFLDIHQDPIPFTFKIEKKIIKYSSKEEEIIVLILKYNKEGKEIKYVLSRF